MHKSHFVKCCDLYMGKCGMLNVFVFDNELTKKLGLKSQRYDINPRKEIKGIRIAKIINYYPQCFICSNSVET